MGAGIAAAIPIILKPYKKYYFKNEKYFDDKYFSKGFFENFNSEETDSTMVCNIKEDLLLNNYKSFLVEFYNLIEKDIEIIGFTSDTIPTAINMEEFFDVFKKENRDSRIPFVYKGSHAFSILGGDCQLYWVFYNGSYKAYLEEYSTLLHLEKIVSKAMTNPLANAIKFGIFG